MATSVASLAGLRENMEKEVWKGVLKSEAVLVEKERALNEVPTASTFDMSARTVDLTARTL